MGARVLINETRYNKSSGGGFLNLGIGSLRLAMADICEMTFQKQKDRLAAVSPKSDLTGL
jgi:hypothetical protein